MLKIGHFEISAPSVTDSFGVASSSSSLPVGGDDSSSSSSFSEVVAFRSFGSIIRNVVDHVVNIIIAAGV